MIRTIAGVLGLLALVYALIYAAPAAVDAEVDDPNNSSVDEYAFMTVDTGAVTLGFIPYVIGVSLIVFVLVKGGLV